MATVRERRIGAVVGAAVADAAAQPLHWIYDAEKLDKLLSNKEEIEFHDPPANPYYRIDIGKNSSYGDQAYVLLKSLAARRSFDVDDFQNRSYTFFGPGSEYDNPLITDYVAKQALTNIYPINTPWRNFSLKDFIKNYEAKIDPTGSDTDDQMDCVAKIAPLVALFAGKPELMEAVEDAIRVTQNNDFTVTIGMAAARLIEQYILHGPRPDALEEVIRQLSDPRRSNPQELDRAMAGMLRQVLEHRDKPHTQVARTIFRND